MFTRFERPKELEMTRRNQFFLTQMQNLYQFKDCKTNPAMKDSVFSRVLHEVWSGCLVRPEMALGPVAFSILKMKFLFQQRRTFIGAISNFVTWPEATMVGVGSFIKIPPCQKMFIFRGEITIGAKTELAQNRAPNHTSCNARVFCGNQEKFDKVLKDFFKKTGNELEDSAKWTFFGSWFFGAVVGVWGTIGFIFLDPFCHKR